MNRVFSDDFWQKFYEKASIWLMETVPAIILIFILLFITLAFYRFLVGKLKNIILKRTQASHHESKEEKEKRVNTLITILRQAGGIVIWIIFMLILLRQVNLDIGPILASAGIVGLAVGFGAQELVRDFISGFFMLLENQVRAGDVAIINGQAGLVEEIALRTITLRDFSGVVHIFQNGKINTLANMTKEWSGAVFDVGIAYKEDTERVKEIMKKVGEQLKGDPEFEEKINEPLEIFGVDSWGDSAVVIRARFKTKPGQQWVVKREFLGRLKQSFDQERVEIPFPHRTIYWGDEINPLKLKLDDRVKGLDPEKEQ